MAWQIEFDDAAKREMKKLDKSVAKRITTFLRERVATDDPRRLGAALNGSRLGSFWKYRVGDYRVICDIQDSVVKILVVKIGHRRDIYN